MCLAWALLRKSKDETSVGVETDDEIYQDGEMVLFPGRDIRDSDVFSSILHISNIFKPQIILKFMNIIVLP